MSDKIKIDLIFQVSICVNDMEAVMKNFRELFDIDESTLIKRCTKDFYDRGEFDGARYLGKHCEFLLNIIGLIWVESTLKSLNRWIRTRETHIQIF